MSVSYEPQLHVVLHQPEIPQNTGNVGRTCVALHAKLWLVRPLGFRMDEARLRRAGLDYWEHLVWEIVQDWNELLASLDGHRMWLFTKRSDRVYTTVQYQPGDALVFGGESLGLPETLLSEHADASLGIPMLGPVRSLNLATTVAIAGYEALRQVAEKPSDG